MIAVASLADEALVLEESQMLAYVSFGSTKSFEQLPSETLAVEQHANDEQPQWMRDATQNSRGFVSVLQLTLVQGGLNQARGRLFR